MPFQSQLQALIYLYIYLFLCFQKALEMLLNHGAKADVGDNIEMTPLHIAAKNGKPKCVKLLCKAAPMVMNSTDEKGRMPLHLAAKHGNMYVSITTF